MNNQKVVMIGLGYIGLPTAALIANNNIHVHGVDIKPEVVETINAGKIHIVEPSLDQAVASAVEKGFLRASTTPIEANTYLIVVPTPFNAKKEADISFIEAATKAIIPLLKENDLYIIESTSSPDRSKICWANQLVNSGNAAISPTWESLILGLREKPLDSALRASILAKLMALSIWLLKARRLEAETSLEVFFFKCRTAKKLNTPLAIEDKCLSRPSCA